MGASRWRWESDERVSATCRDAFGYPRLEQPNEARETILIVVCVALMAAVYASAWFLS